MLIEIPGATIDLAPHVAIALAAFFTAHAVFIGGLIAHLARRDQRFPKRRR